MMERTSTLHHSLNQNQTYNQNININRNNNGNRGRYRFLSLFRRFRFGEPVFPMRSRVIERDIHQGNRIRGEGARFGVHRLAPYSL